MTQPDEPTTRREFLRRLGQVGVSAATVSVGAYLLYDGQGPRPGAGEQAPGLPDFSVPPAMGQVLSVVRGSDRVRMVGRAVELLGGMGRFVQRGERVLLKPNVGFAAPPSLAATAAPELVGEVVRLCYEAGAREVLVTDNPINDAASCFRLSGVGRAAGEAGARVLLPRAGYFRATTLPGGRLIRAWPVLATPLERVDRLIGIAPVKQHHRSGASMTMKNWYGLLGGRRNVFHQDINTIIAELALLVRPTLVILDGTVSMVRNGPTGGSVADLARTNTMIASCDQVAADACGCSLLGLTPADLPYLAQAARRGAGTIDYRSLRPQAATVG